MSGNENEEKQPVKRAIKKAFEGVRLEDGVSLHETMVIDDYGPEAARKEARKLDTQTNWEDVPVEWLADYYEAISFYDPKGFRFYLPAYMIWLLEAYATTTSLAADSVISSLCPTRKGRFLLDNYHSERFKLFSPAQARTICWFLRTMQDEVFDSMSVQIALDEYWGKFCSGEEYLTDS